RVEPGHTLDASLIRDPAEQDLLRLATEVSQVVDQRRADYRAALVEIARLRPALDAFFDQVMVMVEDTKLRANRLALVARILHDFSTIADFSEIVTEKKR